MSINNEIAGISKRKDEIAQEELKLKLKDAIVYNESLLIKNNLIPLKSSASISYAMLTRNMVRRKKKKKRI